MASGICKIPDAILYCSLVLLGPSYNFGIVISFQQTTLSGLVL